MLTKITPVPKNLTVGRKKLAIGKLGFSNFKITSKKLDGALAKNALAELYKGLSLVVGVPAKSADGEVSIKLEMSSRVPECVEKNADQAYKIVVNKNGITLTGYGEAGVYYAVTTLLQTVEVVDNVVLAVWRKGAREQRGVFVKGVGGHNSSLGFTQEKL